MKRRMVLLVAAVLSVLGLALAVPGSAYAGAATDVVKTKQTALFDLIKQNAPQLKTQALFDEMLDYGALAASSLGDDWAPRSDAEKAQFTDLLKQLVRKAYEKNLRKTVGFRIDYLGEDDAGGGATLVKTKATNEADERDEPIEINFKMGQSGGSWKVQDIVTEGVSLVKNYRTTFGKIMKKDGFPGVVAKMKDKLAKGDV